MKELADQKEAQEAKVAEESEQTESKVSTHQSLVESHSSSSSGEDHQGQPQSMLD